MSEYQLWDSLEFNSDQYFDVEAIVPSLSLSNQESKAIPSQESEPPIAQSVQPAVSELRVYSRRSKTQDQLEERAQSGPVQGSNPSSQLIKVTLLLSL